MIAGGGRRYRRQSAERGSGGGGGPHSAEKKRPRAHCGACLCGSQVQRVRDGACEPAESARSRRCATRRPLEVFGFPRSSRLYPGAWGILHLNLALALIGTREKV